VRRGAALAGVAFAVTACGGRAAAPPQQPVPVPVWRANAADVVRQLREDVAVAALGGETRRTARRALASTSDMYALLVTYSDLGGCRAMVAATAAPPRIVRPLLASCTHLQRAAALFSAAATATSPAQLVRATREAQLAAPRLVEASLALRAR
jgi:hypothetical protein